MAILKIVICATREQAELARARLQQRNFQVQLAQEFDDLIWDATQASPADPALAFSDQFVVIGTR
jgi:hypothetical protein